MILKVQVDGWERWIEVEDPYCDSHFPKDKEWEAEIVTAMDAVQRLDRALGVAGIAIRQYEDKLPISIPSYGCLIDQARYSIGALKRILSGLPTEAAL